MDDVHIVPTANGNYHPYVQGNILELLCVHNKNNSLALFDAYEFLQRKMNRILTCMAVCLLLMERVR